MASKGSTNDAANIEKMRGIWIKLSKNDVLKHLDFLKDVDDNYHITEGPILKKAITRYERHWLPMMAKYNLTTMAAPLDIEWVWHCHMLCPAAYYRDCLAVVGKFVPHTLLEKSKRNTKLSSDDDLTYHKADSDDSISKIQYDLEGASSRQRLFYYNVSLSHYRDNRFLETSMERYKKFLYLLQKNPDLFLVPAYDIDLMWHTHQLNPVSYRHDMKRILGKYLNHDDTATDRSDGSKLNNAEKLTRKLWKKEFNEGFARPGAMYRGESSKNQLHELSEPIDVVIPTQSAYIQISEVQLDRLPTKARKAKLEMYNVQKTSFGRNELIRRKLLSKEWTDYNMMLWKGPSLFSCRINVDADANVNFNLKATKGYSFLKKEIDLGSCTLNFLEHVQKMEGDTQCFDEDIKLLFSPIHVKVKGKLNDPRKGHLKLNINEGKFLEVVDVVDKRKEIWGPVPIRQYDTLRRKTSMATHMLTLRNETPLFSCRVVHSTDLNMSAVLVYHGDTLMSYAHLIGSDQLPPISSVENLSTYTSTGAITLNPQNGERAMLIKNNEGDWAVLVGAWTGVKKGVKAVKGTRTRKGSRGVPGSYGYLGMNFYKMSSKMILRGSSLPGKVYNISLGDVICQPRSLELPRDQHEAAENVALAFSISILHVLCQPRSPDWKPGISPNKGRKASKGVNLPMAEEVTFLAAAGIMIQNPCNKFLVDQQKQRSFGIIPIVSAHKPRDVDSESDDDDAASIGGGDISGDSVSVGDDFCGGEFEISGDVDVGICDCGDIGGSVCGSDGGGSGCGAGCGGGGSSCGGGGGGSSCGGGGSSCGGGGSSCGGGGSSCGSSCSSCGGGGSSCGSDD